MTQFFVRTFICLSLVVSLALPSTAWSQGLGGESMAGQMGPRQQLATIIFSGLAGAILGLSTLSFHGRPQEKLVNIAVGFAIGIIAGTSYTTYKAATRPYYSEEVLWLPGRDQDRPTTLSADLQFTPKASWTWDF